MRLHSTGRLALLLVLALAAPWMAPVAQEPPAPQPPVQELPGTGPAQEPPVEPMPEPEQAAEPAMSCGDCHEISQQFVLNPHAKGAVEDGVVPNGTCETCHGDGTAHMEAGGDPALIAVPHGRVGADTVCMMCHDAATDQRSHRSSIHANSAAVNCLSCHSIHHAERRPALLVREDPDLCATCHSTQVASFRSKPFTHRLGTGTMGCATCHEPHGLDGRQNVRRTASGEIACAECHRDKQGPFVFEHGALAAGECSTCHEPHGSTNGHQLKRATALQLCIECHSPTAGEATLGSQPPSFHNINNPRFRHCTTCHVAVHGSNRSPMLLK